MHSGLVLTQDMLIVLGLTGFIIYPYLESWILFGKFIQGNGQFLDVILCLWFNGHIDYRFREYHGSKNDRVFEIT